ncbi:MAG: ABC transporter permease subunit [Anaerolineaceae bacterium]|nr:ABC transporter permease subunit [Anaerolineaceae bacterium]
MTVTDPTMVAGPRKAPPLALGTALWRLLRDIVLLAVAMLGVSWVFREILANATSAVNVEESFTTVIADTMIFTLPFALVIVTALRSRSLLKNRRGLIIGITMLVALAVQTISVGQQALTQTGAYGTQTSVQFTTEQADEGVLVTAIEAGGAAEQAGILVGDVITAIRRDVVDKAALDTAILQSDDGAVLRFRLLRDGEEQQIPVTVTSISGVNTTSIYMGYVALFVTAILALAIPFGWIPYVLLISFLMPLFLGYAWLIIATFSQRTEGLLPVDTTGNFGGLTLDNWSFLSGQMGARNQLDIWGVTLNSAMIAVVMTVIVLLVASMAGYALSRMNFPGRRGFLSMTLILHSFPAVTLLIPIFIVLQNIGHIPLIGDLFGFNTIGGVALIMVAFELPLGIWLMKGFFDGISWDMERSAMIDGATRWRTFFEIILPQIRPGLLALGIFSFLGGWNTYLIPATFMVGTRTSNLPVLIRDLTGEMQPVNWNQVAAVGLYQLIPILLLFVFAQEYLLNIYAGGTKGSS